MATFVHYPTSNGSPSSHSERFLDNVTLEGSIPVIVEDTLTAARRNMSRRAIISGAGRQDAWDYPETALREAIVNALVHRDLSAGAMGSKVHIEMYPDRLVVRNPGGLYGPVTVETLGEDGISSARNAFLIKMLEEVPLPDQDRTVCENRGSGIRAMADALRSAGMSSPRFDDRISSFTVTFPNHTLFSDDTIRWITDLKSQGLSDSQCHALALLNGHDGFDNRTYRETTGVDSRVATAELQDLVARELLEQTGTRRWALYQVAENAAKPSRADRRHDILTALGTQMLSRVDIAERTGFSDQTVRRWLTIMRREGTVELIGDSPRSKHTRYRRSTQQALFDTQ